MQLQDVVYAVFKYFRSLEVVGKNFLENRNRTVSMSSPLFCKSKIR